jgi:hypothetical protein
VLGLVLQGEPEKGSKKEKKADSRCWGLVLFFFFRSFFFVFCWAYFGCASVLGYREAKKYPAAAPGVPWEFECERKEAGW